MQAASKLATYHNLFALESEAKAEVVHGSIITMPSVLPRHARAQGALRSFLGAPFDDDDGRGGPGGG